MPTGEDCTNPVDVTRLGQMPGSEYVCGCGACPEPDPTPVELQAKVDWAWWNTHQWLVSAEA